MLERRHTNRTIIKTSVSYGLKLSPGMRVNTRYMSGQWIQFSVLGTDHGKVHMVFIIVRDIIIIIILSRSSLWSPPKGGRECLPTLWSDLLRCLQGSRGDLLV